MRNPYSAPESTNETREAAGAQAWQVAVSALIVIYCSIQYIAVTRILVSEWRVVTAGMEHPFLFALAKVWQPALLFASGVLLLLRRRLAIAGFVIYLVAAAFSFPLLTSSGARGGFVIVTAITAFALFLEKSGRLKRG